MPSRSLTSVNYLSLLRLKSTLLGRIGKKRNVSAPIELGLPIDLSDWDTVRAVVSVKDALWLTRTVGYSNTMPAVAKPVLVVNVAH